VGEGPVGLRHPVHVVLALERAALLVRRVQDLAANFSSIRFSRRCREKVMSQRTARVRARR